MTNLTKAWGFFIWYFCCAIFLTQHVLALLEIVSFWNRWKYYYIWNDAYLCMDIKGKPDTLPTCSALLLWWLRLLLNSCTVLQPCTQGLFSCSQRSGGWRCWTYLEKAFQFKWDKCKLTQWNQSYFIHVAALSNKTEAII